MYCGQCGKPTTPGANFCQECGAELISKTNSEMPHSDAKKSVLEEEINLTIPKNEDHESLSLID